MWLIERESACYYCVTGYAWKHHNSVHCNKQITASSEFSLASSIRKSLLKANNLILVN